jgi:hypothetical protein
MVAERAQLEVLGTLRHLAVRIRRGSGHRLADPPPFCRPIAGAGKTSRVHKGLGEHRGIAIALRPVLPQSGHAQAQHSRSQIPHADARLDQKPTITHHMMQTGTSHRLAPADEVVAFLHAPLRRAERQHAYPSVPQTFDQVANLRPAQRPLAQIMPPLHQGVPDPLSSAVAAANGNAAALAQFVQSTPKFRGMTQSVHRRLNARALETGLVRRRQDEEPVAMKLHKSFSAAHLFQFAVGGSPIQSFVHPQRLRASGQIDIGKRSPAFPVTLPYVRARIRRFGGLSD